MSNIDDTRIQTSEFETSMTSPDLEKTLKEIDQRVMGDNIWSTITYDVDTLISEVRYYSDSSKTIMILKKVISRTLGTDGIKYISSIVTTSYNLDGSPDSVITTTLNRTNDIITTCESAFSTVETGC
jgi:hypothetical protein